MREAVPQLVDREGLQQIVVDPAGDEVAVEPHVIHRAGGDHDRPGLANFCKRVDVVQRIRGLAKVDEQDVRAGRNRERLDRVAKATFVDLFRAPPVLDGNRPKHIGGGVVAGHAGHGDNQHRGP